MSDDNNDRQQIYIYQGNEGEKVPDTVEKLIVEEGITNLPGRFCSELRLREVILPNGLKTIGYLVFHHCENLLEVTIPSTVEAIGACAFQGCRGLKRITFELSSSSSSEPDGHRLLQEIGKYAFSACQSLSSIWLPSSVTAVGTEAFGRCAALVEADLSKTGLTKISICAFYLCSSLQTVSLPKTVQQIYRMAFAGCPQLVTVQVPLDSNSIRVGEQGFHGCRKLANLHLPKDSMVTKPSAFLQCTALHERYSDDASRIITGLIARFEGFPIHKACYNHSSISLQELQQRVEEHLQHQEELVDDFGMTPFHILFSTIDPSLELLDVLLDSLPNQILKLKDANGRRPVDYLFRNWTDLSKSLTKRTFEKSIIERLARWGIPSWMKAMKTMKTKVRELLAEENQFRRVTLCDKMYIALEHYENLESTSVLEMALWKCKIKSGRTSDGTKRQALDREGCRCLSGSDIVIPKIASLLGLSRNAA